MKPIMFLLMFGLAAAGGANAIEQSVKTIDGTDNNVANAAQDKNNAARLDTQNKLAQLKQQLEDIRICNINQQLWTGSGCQSLNIVSATLLPTQSVTPDYLPGGSYVEDRSCGSCSGSGICYISYWSCSTAILRPVITISGTTVIIQPKVCSSANRRRYYEPTCGPAPPAGILYNDWY